MSTKGAAAAVDPPGQVKSKTRLGVVLRESAGKKSTNASADLMALTDKYNLFVKKLHALLQVLSQHHAAMVQLDKTRTAVSRHMANLSKNTPMFEATGMLPSADRPSDTVCSYASVHDNLSAKSKTYADKYKQFVLDYVAEWEKVVTTRVSAGLKKAEILRRDLDHYQKKVESLRLAANQAMAKGKSVTPQNAEKLSRNEEKLVAAKQTYNKVSTDMCILMEEIADRNWRDLHPVLVKCAQFDMTLSSDEAKVLGSLNTVVNSLKDVATKNGLSPQARLKDLANLNPELLSTRPGGVTGFTAIESGPSSTSSLPGSFGALGGTMPTSTLPMAQPPGTVGPQGMGGFPVQISNAAPVGATAYDFKRSDSYNSAPSALEPPSTMTMLTISQSAAPAPTLDDVYSANAGAGPMTIRSAPNSGNLPPASPYSRSGSFHSTGGGSMYSDISVQTPPAPAPAAPPPPPPASAPPVPPSYGAPPPPMAGYGAPPPAPPPYGAPPPAAYGAPPPVGGGGYGQQQQPTSPWALSNQPPAPAGYGLPPTSSSPYGGAPPPAPTNTNPFG